MQRTLGTQPGVVVGLRIGPMSTLGLTPQTAGRGYRPVMGEDRAVSWRDVLVPLLVYAIAVAEAVSYDPPDLEIALLLE